MLSKCLYIPVSIAIFLCLNAIHLYIHKLWLIMHKCAEYINNCMNTASISNSCTISFT